MAKLTSVFPSWSSFRASAEQFVIVAHSYSIPRMSANAYLKLTAKKHLNKQAKTKTLENKLRESSITGKLSSSSTCTHCYSLAMCLSLMPFAQKRRESAQQIQPSHGLDASYQTSNGKSKDLIPFATIF